MTDCHDLFLCVINHTTSNLMMELLSGLDHIRRHAIFNFCCFSPFVIENINFEYVLADLSYLGNGIFGEGLFLIYFHMMCVSSFVRGSLNLMIMSLCFKESGVFFFVLNYTLKILTY